MWPKCLVSQVGYLERQDLFGDISSDMFIRNKKPHYLVVLLGISPE